MGIRCAVQISSVCVPLRHVHHLHTCLAGACQVIPERTDPPRHTPTHQISTHFYVTPAYLRNERWIVCHFIIRNIQSELFRVLSQTSPNISGVPLFLIKLHACPKGNTLRPHENVLKFTPPKRTIFKIKKRGGSVGAFFFLRLSIISWMGVTPNKSHLLVQNFTLTPINPLDIIHW